MSKVYVAFSGEYFCMEVYSKQVAGLFPAFRIEAIFNTKKKCEKWINSYQKSKSMSFISCMKLDLNPIFGEKDSEMQLFRILMNKDLHIIEVTIQEDNLEEYKELRCLDVQENGDFVGYYWARDFLDACKVAYITVKESLEK